LPSFMKHIRYLEDTGWIRTRKSGRVRTCTLERDSFEAIETWLGEQRRIWEDRTDRLERFVTAPQDKETLQMISSHPELDLTVARIIAAPRSAVWNAWTDSASFEQWWVPAPQVCRVREMDLRPGGSLRTEISDDGADFGPHLTACFLAVDELERIVFTDALVAGWRPAEASFMTAVISMSDHPDGTEYTATAMHRNLADRDRHEQLGFQEGWGTVTRQLAELVESA
jgi:uncharacterized protein YndB with AHSA1/START domain